MKPLPDYVAHMRQGICQQRKCTAIVDYRDPCAKCPNGHFGPTSFECASAKTACAAPEGGQPTLPPLLKRATNLARATSAEAAAIMQGAPPISEEEALRRFAICQTNACGKFIARGEQCAACGCYMRQKTAWRSQSCPVGKW